MHVAFRVWMNGWLNLASFICAAQEKPWFLIAAATLLSFSPSVLQAQDWFDRASKMSPGEVSAMEQRLQRDPENLRDREMLVTYYTLKGLKSKRLEQSLWLTKHHPEAVGDCPYAQIAEQDSPFDSMAAFEEAKALWLSYADSRTTDPRVLLSAAKFIWQFDPNLSERLLLQGRQLEPDRREWVLALSDLYGKGIFTDGRFRPQPPPSPARHQFALRSRLVLMASNDPLIVGLAGLRLAPQDAEILRTRSQEDIDLGQKLLRKAHALAPADPQWTIYLHDFEMAKQDLTRTDRPLPDFGSAPPGTLVRRVKAEYPQSATTLELQGVVRLKILVGISGRVIYVRPEDGPVELQSAAVEAVKQWVYKPFELNGSPVETWREVALSFP